MKTKIRWMIRRDMPTVLDIEQRSFDFPWTEADFVKALRQRNCIGMVAEQGERVVGFVIYELHKTRLHILNFAVDFDHRRQGVGRQMVDKLVGKLNTQRRNLIDLAIIERNLGAQEFFAACGFRAENLLRNFYKDNDDDAYWFAYRLREPAEKPEPAHA